MMNAATRLGFLALCAAPMAACAPQADDAQSRLRAPQANVLGPAENCVQVRRIENTMVHDDYTIDFEMAGGRTYRNTLPNRCPSLGFEQRFAYKVTTGQLCNVDVITVLYSDGREGASCGLGQFVPIELVETDEG